VIEAELKARVRDPDGLHARLSDLAAGERSVYRDVYYDHPGRDLAAAGRELRLRVVESAGGTRSLLTFKEPAVDAASGSKPEHETQVSDPVAVGVLLAGVGLEVVVGFEKHCTNYRFSRQGRQLLATVVTVPELDGTFIELETMTEPGDVDAALADIRAVLLRLGVDSGDFTTEQYTDAVMASWRSQRLCKLAQGARHYARL
jgi:adenylate cyclase, class 2